MTWPDVYVTVTAGQEGGHSKGSAHETGAACDVGKNSNPNLTRAKTEQCFQQCFPAGSSWGQEEGNHYHMQTRPGASGDFKYQISGLIYEQLCLPRIHLVEVAALHEIVLARLQQAEK